MIRAENITKRFEDCVALHDVTCHIESGSIYGMVGSNGAGKSTLLRLLSGVYKPDSGTIRIDGEEVYDNPAAKSRMVLVPDELYFLPGANLRRMAKLYESFYPRFDWKRFHSLAESFQLDETRAIRGFSKGMKRQSAILLALSTQADYYFFDETFDGLDPIMRRLVKEGDVEELKSTLFKVQIAFSEPFDESLFQDLRVEKCRINGTVAQLILRGDREEVMDRLQYLDPVILEIVPLNLEEIFTYELKEKGYSFDQVLEQEAKTDEEETV